MLLMAGGDLGMSLYTNMAQLMHVYSRECVLCVKTKQAIIIPRGSQTPRLLQTPQSQARYIASLLLLKQLYYVLRLVLCIEKYFHKNAIVLFTHL